MTADQLYHRGVQLVRRMVAPLKLTEALEFAILRPWVCASVSKKARMVLDARTVNSAIELIDALQDHLVMEQRGKLLCLRSRPMEVKGVEKERCQVPTVSSVVSPGTRPLNAGKERVVQVVQVHTNLL